MKKKRRSRSGKRGADMGVKRVSPLAPVFPGLSPIDFQLWGILLVVVVLLLLLSADTPMLSSRAFISNLLFPVLTLYHSRACRHSIVLGVHYCRYHGSLESRTA